MSLKIAPTLTLPDEAVTQTFGILAKRGMGKTYTASVMVEEMLKSKLHVVVIDPIGVWHGLRSSADGKHEGLPIVIAGGEHADIPITPNSGEIVADFLIDNTVSIVVDLSLFRKNETTTFMTDFSETLYRRNRNALHLVLDEADAFAPQQPRPDTARMLGAIEDIVRRGRARGIGVTMITQRPAVLNKNVLTQIESLITLRLTAPNDQKAVDEWIKTHAEDDQRDLFMQSLPSLPVGEAWFWSPGWLDKFQRIKVRKRETLDSSSTPKAGVKVPTATVKADVNLEALRERMAATIEEVEQNDPKVLKRRIAELERELKSQKPKVEVREVIKTVEVNKLDAETAQNLLGLAQSIIGMAKDITLIAAPIDKPTHKNPPLPTPAAPRQVTGMDPASGRDKSVVTIHGGETDETLSKAERALLGTLAQYPQGRTNKQMAILSGYSAKSGSFKNALAKLRSKGYAEGYGTTKATPDGLAALGSYEPLPTGEALMEYWLNKLGKAESTILRILLMAAGNPVTTAEIAEMSEYSPSSGSFKNALARLRSLELADGYGEVRAADVFYE